MNKKIIYPDDLMHTGIKGMRWGLRNYQTYDAVPRISGQGGDDSRARALIKKRDFDLDSWRKKQIKNIKENTHTRIELYEKKIHTASEKKINSYKIKQLQLKKKEQLSIRNLNNMSIKDAKKVIMMDTLKTGAIAFLLWAVTPDIIGIPAAATYISNHNIDVLSRKDKQAIKKIKYKKEKKRR